MSELNEQQIAVAKSTANRTIVLAGAGTGKTTAAVEWVAEHIRLGIAPEKMAMVTFTRKAAHQMKERLVQSVGVAGKSVMVGTYHSIAARLAKINPTAFNLENRNFSILDESDSESLVREAFRQCGQKSRAPLTISAVKKTLSNSINRQVPLIDALSDELDEYEGEIKSILEHYTLLKQHAQALDYDDLLLLWKTALKGKFGDKMRKQFTHVLVDEFQDNNQLNYQILTNWNPDVLMVIGDKQQSIYGFRGADAKLVDTFIAEATQPKILKLDLNYRSGQDILDVANRIIEKAPFALTLQSATDNVADVTLQEFYSSKEEATSVVQAIKTQIGTNPPEVAVLCRTGRGLLPLEIELRRHKISYKKYGGTALADNAAIKDFLSVLRVHHNSKDRVALIRALLLFPKIGEVTAQKLLGDPTQPLPELNVEDWPERAKALGKWLKDLKTIDTLKAKGEYIFEAVSPLLIQRYPEDFANRLGDVQEVVNIMEGEQDLGDFLDLFVLHRGFEREHPQESIVLSTIHSAKGLEWDNVFLFNCSNAIIPGRRALTRESIEEERRLLYVAITRGRYSLSVSCNGEQEGLTSLW